MIKTPPTKNMEGAFSVAGKNVVVTGGNTGIGYGIATAFAQSGANVAILCRSIESGEKAAADMRGYGVKSEFFKCDIADPASVEATADEVCKFFGHVDVLINNAGIGSTTEFLADKNLSEWHRIIDTNLHGVANMVHAFAPKMRDAGLGGEIINISSVGGQRVSNQVQGHHNPPYHAAKAGVDIFTKYLAIDLGDYGIRVNCVAPGMTHSNLDKDLPEAYKETAVRTLPTHRFGEPIEIGALCVFLSSPAAVQITGCIHAHDGGAMCTR